jgi:hypothetical protein
MARLKVRLLSEGLRVEPNADEIPRKPSHRVRSGSCGGLDLVLPDGTWINAPVNERFARRSVLRLVLTETGPAIDDRGQRIPVELVPCPGYYDHQTTSGTAMVRLAQLCSDRVGIGLTNVCTFWRSRSGRCRFCSIGLNVRDEDARKPIDDIVEATLAALADPIAPARHILLGGGTPNDEDTGAPQIAELASRLRARTDVSIYAMLAPPRDLGLLALLRDAGVDEIGLNIELFTDRAARRYIPAKHRAIGHDRYWYALERCVELFGPLNTRSITVVGLEEPAHTVAGVSRLASMGVLPILSPLRPLAGTHLEEHATQTSNNMWELLQRAASAAAEFDVPLGPLCIPCQSNTLTLPGDRRYRYY